MVSFGRMTRWAVIAMFACVMLTAQAYAVELWSNDLWLEQPTVPTTDSPSPTTPSPTNPVPTAPTPSTPPSGTGLWSENLWNEPTAPIDESNMEQEYGGDQSKEQESDQQQHADGESADHSQLPLPQPNMPSKPDMPPAGEGHGLDPNQSNETENLNSLTNEDKQEPSDAQEVPLLVMQIGNPNATVRGSEVLLPVPPAVVNGRTMVPLRLIGESLQANFQWVAEEKKIVIEMDSQRMEVWIGSERALVNGQEVSLDAPPITFNGVTLVPIRFISEHFGYEIRFDQSTRTITIYGSGESSNDEHISDPGMGEQPETNTQTETEQMIPDSSDSEPPVEQAAYSKYIGVWQLRLDGFSKGLEVGTLIVYSDGTYKMSHGVNGDAEGTWHGGGFGDVIGNADMIILENGPGGMDWTMIPKQDGIMSIRYHYGYTGSIKVWFEDSLGIRISD